MSGIIGLGAYVPRLRLRRASVAEALGWLSPGLYGRTRGERSMANWDEDSLTMGVEASRDALGRSEDRDDVEALYFASTTMPFAERQNSAIVGEALTLREDVFSVDMTGSQRVGSTALVEALLRAQRQERVLLVVSDHRKTRAASSQELNYGDGAVAFVLGQEDGVARFLGSATMSADFVSHFRGSGELFDYHWEERWIRDEGMAKIVPATVRQLLEQTGVKAEEVSHFILPSTIGKQQERMAKDCGLSQESICSPLAQEMGEAGTAHALIMLAQALETAKAGEKLLVVQFGSGCNALLFEATGAKPMHQGLGVSGHLAAGQAEENYMKFLVFNGLLEWEKGMRAEQDKKTALTTLWRNRRMILGLVGGKCKKTGVIQFPMSRISVNPQDAAVDTQEPYKFAERKAKILSWSGDYLSFGVSPPNHYGMMVFEGGGRIMLDITDVSAGEVETGMEMRMVFRIKDIDSRRGFTRYYWKAVPVR